jgi:hypothetical protein
LNEKPEPHSETTLLPQLTEAVVRVYRGYTNGSVLITSKDGTLHIFTDKRLPPDMPLLPLKIPAPE